MSVLVFCFASAVGTKPWAEIHTACDLMAPLGSMPRVLHAINNVQLNVINHGYNLRISVCLCLNVWEYLIRQAVDTRPRALGAVKHLYVSMSARMGVSDTPSR